LKHVEEYNKRIVK